jgi:hypothetical protein
VAPGLPILLSSPPRESAYYGSQIIAVTQGIDVSSKEIDLLCPSVTLKAIEEAYAESSRREEMRIELIKSRRGHVLTIYYPLDEKPIPIEILRQPL